jgi:hypothetical protein
LALSSLHRIALALLALVALPSAVEAGRAHAEIRRGLEWSQLTAEQQRILAPLADDWANIEPPRRAKWVDIAKRYPKMTPAQQQRLQSRMKQWASLSPQERTLARERYKKLQQFPPEKRDEIRRRWREYDALTEQEKHQLRQARPPSPATKPSRTFEQD